MDKINFTSFLRAVTKGVDIAEATGAKGPEKLEIAKEFVKKAGLENVQVDLGDEELVTLFIKLIVAIINIVAKKDYGQITQVIEYTKKIWDKINKK